LTATVLALENKMPILLFGLAEENSIVKAAQGASNGTTITV
jgi:uridylate kinase